MKPGAPITVVGVMSSARLNGNTARLVRAALRGAEEAGAQTSEILLAQLQIGFCQGCLRCMAEGRCSAADDFEQVRRQLSEAQGMILSSPTYGAAPCARMKNLIDRFGLYEYFASASFGGKYLVGISTANSAGTARKVARGLAQQFAAGVFQRGYVSGTLGASSRGNGVTADSAAVPQARALGSKLVHDIQSGKRYPLQNPVGSLMNRYLLKPNFRKAILDYREGMMKGVYESLQQRELL